MFVTLSALNATGAHFQGRCLTPERAMTPAPYVPWSLPSPAGIMTSGVWAMSGGTARAAAPSSIREPRQLLLHNPILQKM